MFEGVHEIGSLSVTVKHKTERKAISSKLLACLETLLSWIVMADETWVYHFEPDTKRQFVEWHHSQSPHFIHSFIHFIGMCRMR
jgi:hypothetical protein